MGSVKKSPFRIIATLLLVIAILSLSGLTATAASFADAGSISSCCDSDCDDDTRNDETQKKSGPCSTPDCPCFSCISMVMAAPFALRYFSTVETIAFIPTRNYQLSEYIVSIDYPPEIA